jgi:hypothetical protein
MKFFFTLPCIFLFIISSSLKAKEYKSVHEFTINVNEKYLYTSPIVLDDIINNAQSEFTDKFPDFDHFKDSMKVLEGQEYKVEYIVEVKDPYSTNNITITSDNLKDFPQWKDAKLNEETIDTICASSEKEYSAFWSKQVRFKKCIIHPKIKNSIFLEMDGIVANTQIAQLLLFENDKMYVFSLTCANKCKQWKKVFSSTINSIDFD